MKLAKSWAAARRAASSKSPSIFSRADAVGVDEDVHAGARSRGEEKIECGADARDEVVSNRW